MIFTHLYKNDSCVPTPYCEPVWPSDKALAGKRRDLGSNQLRLSILFKSCGL